MELAERARRLLPGLWAGGLLAIAAIVAPAAFAVLPRADAGRVVARLFEAEAATSLVLGLAVVVLERRHAPGLGAGALLALAAIFCTAFGYYGLQPMMDAARAGQGRFGFGALHAASTAFFAAKTLAVAALAWRAAGGLSRPAPSS